MPSNNLPLSFTAAFTCTIPFSSTSGLISDIRPSVFKLVVAKGVTSTLSPFWISGNSLSNTVKEASRLWESITVQNASVVDATFSCLAKRFAIIPSKGAISVAFCSSYWASWYWASARSYPLFTRARLSVAGGTFAESSSIYPWPINTSFNSSLAFSRASLACAVLFVSRKVASSAIFCPLFTRSPFFT